MLKNPRKGDKVKCIVDDLLKGLHDIPVPSNGEIVTVRKVRIYENVGFCISLKEYREESFFHVSGFEPYEPDLDFVNDLIKRL